MKPKLVYIEWDDASHRSGWHLRGSIDDWVTKGELNVKTVGWIVKETKKYIVVSPSFHPENDYTEIQFLGLQKIPKPWLRKRKVLKP